MRLRPLLALIALLLLLLGGASGTLRAADATPPKDELSTQERQISQRFRELRDKLTHMADLLAASNPRQANLLRMAVARSIELGTDEHLTKVIELLQRDQLAQGVKGQIQVERELQQLLELLESEDRAKRLDSEKKRLQEYLRRITNLLREQRALRAATQRRDSFERLTAEQQRLADQAGELSLQIEKTEGRATDPNNSKPPAAGNDSKPDPSKPEKEPSEGKPSEGKPDGAKPAGDKSDDDDAAHPAQAHLDHAQDRMQAAKEHLRKNSSSPARDQQNRAIEELEQAKGALEDVLRQIREEQQGQRLKQLAARFQEMLKLQNEVHDATHRVDQLTAEARSVDEDLETGRLARREQALVTHADKALLLLREDDSAAPFTEAVTQVRGDVEQIHRLLVKLDTGELTQSLEREVIASLEDLLNATKKAQKDLETRKDQSRGGGGGGGSGDQALVQRIEELRMIRLMEGRIHQRTKRLSDMAPRTTDAAELEQGLRELATRQQRLRRITHDLGQEASQ